MNSIGLGIIGMGYTGWQHLRVAAAMPQVRVAAVADTLAERLAGLPAGVAAHLDWRALLAAV